MRRCFSILLILFFGFGPLSALIDGEDANLPPCCRRHGAHHCAMAAHMAEMMQEAGSGPQALAGAPMTCSEYPGAAARLAAPAAALTAAAAGLPALQARARVAPAEYAAPESTRTRAHSGRGPPQNLS